MSEASIRITEDKDLDTVLQEVVGGARLPIFMKTADGAKSVGKSLAHSLGAMGALPESGLWSGHAVTRQRRGGLKRIGSGRLWPG